jgi:hypothetical protein
MAWERIKHMLRTCPSHGVNEWTILHSFYNGLNYMSRNILDSAAGGAFMGKTIVEDKAILESILQNYSQCILRELLCLLVTSQVFVSNFGIKILF